MDDEMLKQIGIDPNTLTTFANSPTNAQIESQIQGGGLGFPGLGTLANAVGISNLSDLAKVGTIAGGLYGASQSSAPTIINPGYSGGIPEMYASRKMITAPPTDRRPGSGGINYGGDVTFEATGRRLGEAGSTSAPGYEGVVNPTAPPVKYDTLKPTDPQERVMRAYDYFVNEVKGNSPEARQAAIAYLKGKGFTDSQIGEAYQEFMKRFGGKSTLSQEELINELKGSGLDLAAAYNIAQKGGYSVNPEDLFQAMATMGATPTYENTLRLGTDPKVVATMYDKFVKEVGIGDTPEVRAYATSYLKQKGVPDADIKAALQLYSTTYTPPKTAGLPAAPVSPPNFSTAPGATAGPSKPAPSPAPTPSPSPAPAYYEPEPIYYNTLTPDTAPSRVADAYTQFVKEVGIGDTPEVRAYAADYLRGQGFSDAQIKSSLGFAKGGLAPEGFVIPADVVSHLGNGSSEAGLELLARELGAKPIKGEGDGMSDSIPTTIGGKQPARVANEEAFVSPEMVKKLGGGDTERGAKKLYAMMDRIRKARTGTTEQGKQINPEKFMPGGKVEKYQTGGLTNAGSSLASWAGPYVADMLGKGKALSEMPYQAYTGPLTAGESPLQQQAFGAASQYQVPTGIAAAGTTAGQIGQKAQGLSYAPVGGLFGTAEAQQYMNPYLEAALAPQLKELTRLSDVQRQADAARAAGSGAFGGSRQAIMESEARRNLLGKQGDVLSQGYATAYDKAAAQFNEDQRRKIQEAQFGSELGLKGLQTGLQAAETQGRLGATEATAGLDRIRSLADLGQVQRGIEAEGIAADKAQFEEARVNPYKMVQFQQGLLSGLPLAAQSLYQPGASNLQQFASGFTTIDQLLKSLGLNK